MDHAILDSWSSANVSIFGVPYQTQDLAEKIYADMLFEMYHCAKHQAIYQSITPNCVEIEDELLLKFLYKIGQNDLGMEKLVVHDLSQIDESLCNKLISSSPKPSTMAFISYLHYISIHYPPVAKLAFRYALIQARDWIAIFFQQLNQVLDLEDNQQTFMCSSSASLRASEDEVRKLLMASCNTTVQQDKLIEVVQTTTYMVASIFDSLNSVEKSSLAKQLKEGLIAA